VAERQEVEAAAGCRMEIRLHIKSEFFIAAHHSDRDNVAGREKK